MIRKLLQHFPQPIEIRDTSIIIGDSGYLTRLGQSHFALQTQQKKVELVPALSFFSY